MTDQNTNWESPIVDDNNDDNSTSIATATQQQRGRDIRRSARGQQRGGQRALRLAERQFLFIDASNHRSASGEAVRVHVMREAHRTRRERQGIQAQTQRRRIVAQDEIVIFESSNPSQSMSASATLPAASIDWPSIIHAGTSIATTASLDTLHPLAEDLRRNTSLPEPDMLPLCRNDLLSMTAYLALATHQLATSPQDPATIASAQFEARGLELLRQRINLTTEMHSDATIVSVLLLSRLEGKGNAESEVFHRNALDRLVRDRGGMDVLREENEELYGVLRALGLGN